MHREDYLTVVNAPNRPETSLPALASEHYIFSWAQTPVSATLVDLGGLYRIVLGDPVLKHTNHFSHPHEFGWLQLTVDQKTRVSSFPKAVVWGELFRSKSQRSFVFVLLTNFQRNDPLIHRQVPTVQNLAPNIRVHDNLASARGSSCGLMNDQLIRGTLPLRLCDCPSK